jgi:hypothetical protein
MEIAKMIFKVLMHLAPKVKEYVEKIASGKDVTDDEVRAMIPKKYRTEIDDEIKTAWRKDHGMPT